MKLSKSSDEILNFDSFRIILKRKRRIYLLPNAVILNSYNLHSNSLGLVLSQTHTHRHIYT